MQTRARTGRWRDISEDEPAEPDVEMGPTGFCNERRLSDLSPLPQEGVGTEL